MTLINKIKELKLVETVSVLFELVIFLLDYPSKQLGESTLSQVQDYERNNW